MQATIPVMTIVVLGFCALFSLALPIVLAIIWHKKSGAKWSAFLIGALIFVFFVFVLENLCHQFFIYGNNNISAYVMSNAWAYVLYASFAAGIFEETGRYVAFRFLLRKQNDRSCGVMYGIGHGGIEVILICTVSMISSIALAISVNTAGAQAMLSSVPADMAESLRISIEALQTSSPFYFLISPYERIIALALHIALSIIVFTAVKRKKLYLYPVAILLHALVDSVAALYQYGLISSIYLVEGIVTAIVIVVTLYACRIYRSDKYNDPEEPEPSPEVSPE